MANIVIVGEGPTTVTTPPLSKAYLARHMGHGPRMLGGATTRRGIRPPLGTA